MAPRFLHDHVALTVRDLQVSREFYEDLGGRVVSRPSPAFMEIVLGDIRLHLVRAERGTEPGKPASRIDHLCLRVPSVADLALLEGMINAHPLVRGRPPCHVEESPPLGADRKEHCEERPPQKTLYFEDPDGIRLEVRAYAKQASPLPAP
jgi:catechol 2,3-dioxygenase-like lactoylglutathione lyase family enzyme